MVFKRSKPANKTTFEVTRPPLTDEQRAELENAEFAEMLFVFRRREIKRGTSILPIPLAAALDQLAKEQEAGYNEILNAHDRRPQPDERIRRIATPLMNRLGELMADPNQQVLLEIQRASEQKPWNPS